MVQQSKIVGGVLQVSDDGATWREATADDPSAGVVFLALREAKRTGQDQEVWGATSAETAIVVGDYPYGRLRTLMRYWQEYREGHGVRLVTQSQNPKTGRWNKPHASTYCLWGTLALTPAGHVERRCLSEYEGVEKALAFVRSFGSFRWEKYPEERAVQRRGLKTYCLKKARYCEAMGTGRAVWTINGEPRPESDESKAAYLAEADQWRELAAMIAQ